MQAAVLKRPEKLAVMDIPRPQADGEFLVVKVMACGICGSDIRYYAGENPWALHTLGRQVPNPPNLVFGHEFAGVVDEVKNPAFLSLVGRRVSVLAFKGCGCCAQCHAGLYNLCAHTLHLGHGAGWGQQDFYPGGMAEYCKVWNTHVMLLPDNISYEEATLLDPISVAIHAITQSGLRPGEDVVILGAGAVGVSIAQAVRAFGARRVMVTDISDFPLRLAHDLGVTDAINVTREDVVTVARRTMGGADVVFDTVGSAKTQTEALALLRPGGRLVNLVANATRAAYRPVDLAGDRRIVSTANNRYEDYVLGLSLIENGTIDAMRMITQRLALADVQQGFDIMRDKRNQPVMKVVLLPQSGREGGVV